jgi:hypothetical protein
VTAMQLIFIILLLVWRFEDFTIFSFFLYIPFLFSIITQNDIYFYDLTISIETLLATPLHAVQILKAKGKFVIIKSAILGGAMLPVYLVFSYVNDFRPNILMWKEALLLLLCLMLQYSLSVLIGMVAWVFGKSSRIGIIIGQGLILNGLIVISSWDFKMCGAVIAVLIIIMYAASKVLIKWVRTENIIKRCI